MQADQLFGADRFSYEDKDARVQTEATVHPRACVFAVRCPADSRFLGRILHHQIRLSFVYIEDRTRPRPSALTQSPQSKGTLT